MISCRLHERKLLRLQQEEEAELVAQRERELELQVALASLVTAALSMYCRMWSSTSLTQAAHLARSLLIFLTCRTKPEILLSAQEGHSHRHAASFGS